MNIIWDTIVISTICMVSSLAFSQNQENKSINVAKSSSREKVLFKKKKIEIINSEISILNFKHDKISKILFSNSLIVGLNAQNMVFDQFIANSTVFKNARMTGSKFKKCHLKDVTIIDSDLSFTNFKSCKLINVQLQNTAQYELSSF